jgi:hypothetical protein
MGHRYFLKHIAVINITYTIKFLFIKIIGSLPPNAKYIQNIVGTTDKNSQIAIKTQNGCIWQIVLYNKKAK